MAFWKRFGKQFKSEKPLTEREIFGYQKSIGASLGEQAIVLPVRKREVALKEAQWGELFIRSTFGVLIWPMIIFLLLIGPGLSGIVAIFESLNLWIWIGGLIIGILIWRNLQ